MIELFGISQEEAEGRIASAFGSLDLQAEDTENFLGNHGVEHCAKAIYYGPDVKYWLVDESTLEPAPWP